MGTSLAQGGSGYPFFAPSVFEYFSGKDLCSISVRREEIPDPEAEKTFQKACFAPLIKHCCYLSYWTDMFCWLR